MIKRLWYWLLGLSYSCYGRGVEDGRRDWPTEQDLTEFTVEQPDTDASGAETEDSPTTPTRLTFKLANVEEEQVNRAEHDIADRLEKWGKVRQTYEAKSQAWQERLKFLVSSLAKLRGAHQSGFSSRQPRVEISKRAAFWLMLCLAGPETIVSKSALDVFRLDQSAVWMWAIILTVCVIVVAHWLGKILKQYQSATAKRRVVFMAVGFVLLLVLTCYALVVMRDKYLVSVVARKAAELGKPVELPGIEAFVTIAAINLLVMGVNMLLSYKCHDESAELEHIVRELRDLERAVAKQQAQWISEMPNYDKERSSAKRDIEKIQYTTLIKISQYRDGNRRSRPSEKNVPESYKQSISRAIFRARDLGNELDHVAPTLNNVLDEARKGLNQTPLT